MFTARSLSTMIGTGNGTTDVASAAARRRRRFWAALPGEVARRDPHAAAAHHTAIDKQRDVLPHFAAFAGEGAHVGPPLGLAVVEVVVLQPAFPRLVADRAVDRMVEQNPLLHEVLVGAHLGAVGDDDCSVFGRGLAGRHELGHHRDFARLLVLRPCLNETHPTTGHDRQPRVPGNKRGLRRPPGRPPESAQPLGIANPISCPSITDLRRHSNAQPTPPIPAPPPAPPAYILLGSSV